MRILLTLIDPSALGRLDYTTMSQQALMECLVAHLDEKPLQSFRDKKKHFRDISDWNGVECDTEGDVVGINWQSALGMWITGSINLQWLPPTLEDLSVEYEGVKPVMGTLHLRELPRSLQSLVFEFREKPVWEVETSQVSSGLIEVTGSFSDLPESIETFHIYGCTLNMPFCLTDIPEMLHEIDITHHAFGNIDLQCDSMALENLSARFGTKQGTVSFVESPPALILLDLTMSKLVGSLSFEGLGDFLQYLVLDDNNFHGVVVFEDLPDSLEELSIHRASFEKIVFNAPLPDILMRFHADSSAHAGTIDFMHFPQTTDTITISDNQLSGSVRIAHLVHMYRLSASQNRLEGSLEFRKLPDSLQELDLSANQLNGTVDLSALSRNLRELYLQNNNLAGSFVIESLPPNLKQVDLSNNKFEMDALVVPVGAKKLPQIDLRCNGIQKVTNPKGRKIKANTIHF